MSVNVLSLYESLFYAAIGLMTDYFIVSVALTLVNSVKKIPAFRDWFRAAVEDGDQTPHQKDLSGTVTIAFGAVFLFVTLNVAFGSLIFGVDRIPLIGSLFGFSCVLLGVGHLIKK